MHLNDKSLFKRSLFLSKLISSHFVKMNDSQLNEFHDRSRGRHPYDFQSTLISIAFLPNLKVEDNSFKSKHNSKKAF